MATFNWFGQNGFVDYFFNASSVKRLDSDQRTSTSFKAVYGLGENSWQEFSGFAFSYSPSGVPANGTVTTQTTYKNGQVLSTLTGIDVAVSKLVEIAITPESEDDRQLYRSIFSKNDRITGGKATDWLYGFDGNDTIIGGVGGDSLHGGRGADKFIYRNLAESKYTGASDTILDFSRAQGDKIDLRLIDANKTAKGNQAFKFIGTHDFNLKAGELRYESHKSGTILITAVEGDINGDGTPDFYLTLSKVKTLHSTDFYL